VTAPLLTLLLTLVASAAEPRVITLADALAAAESHPQVRQAEALAGQAEARARQSFAAMLPSLNGTVGTNLSFKLFDLGDDTGNVIPGGAGGILVSSGGTFGDPAEQFAARLTGSQLLFDFKTTYGWLSSRRSAAAAEEDAVDTEVQVGLGVRQAYFAAVATKALVGVAEEVLANEDRHYEQAVAFVEVGTRPPIDVAEARRTRATARLQLVRARGDHTAALARLAQAMGVQGELDFDVADEAYPPLDLEDEALDTLVATAMAQRPDVAAIEERLDAQAYAVKAAKGATLPSLALTTILSTDGRSTKDLQGTMNAGVGLSVPVFQGGALRAITRQQRFALEALAAQRDQLTLQVRTEVAQALVAVRTQREAVDAAQEVVDAADAELALAEGRYDEGVGSAIELFNARVAVRNALGQQVQAAYDLATARAQLEAALGRR
jgi:outer membrane protein